MRRIARLGNVLSESLSRSASPTPKDGVKYAADDDDDEAIDDRVRENGVWVRICNARRGIGGVPGTPPVPRACLGLRTRIY